MGRVCFNLVRALIIIENIVVATLATLLIYVSFSAMDQDFGMDALNDSHPKNVHAYIAAISAGVGIIIALLSLLGLIGAIKKSKSALIVYAGIIFFMITILAVFAALSLTVKTSNANYKEVDRSIVSSTISIYNHTDSNDVKTKILDQIQRRLSCCGINSPDDWKNSALRKIPKSCCSNHTESSQPLIKYCEQSDHKTGCWRAVTDYLHANLSIARYALYLIIAFGLVCSLAAYFMVTTLKRSLEVV